MEVVIVVDWVGARAGGRGIVHWMWGLKRGGEWRANGTPRIAPHTLNLCLQKFLIIRDHCDSLCFSAT